jgi:hypothetical protein
MALLALTVAAAVTPGVRRSAATFTTTSHTGISARTEQTSDWLRVWSQSTDPAHLGNYATRRLSSPLVPAAESSNESLSVDLGGYPDLKQDFDLKRVFTLETPSTFPDPGITQITVAATLYADPGGAQPLRKVTLTPTSGAGNQTTVTLGTGQQYQLNVTVRSKRNFEVGTTYYPHVVITVTFTGSPANYYYFDVPMAFTDAGQ